MNLSLRELLDYMQEEQDRWQKWFATHGDEPLAIPLSGELHRTLGAMIQHTLGTELWFSKHLRGLPITEWWKEPATQAAVLFRRGSQAKLGMRQLLDETRPEDWPRTVELKGGGRSYPISARKAVGQAAIIAREHGIAPPGDHDMILSRALD